MNPYYNTQFVVEKAKTSGDETENIDFIVSEYVNILIWRRVFIQCRI